MKKCIFDDIIDCEHYVNGEYRCIAHKLKCENMKYELTCGVNRFGLTSLTFKEQ